MATKPPKGKKHLTPHSKNPQKKPVSKYMAKKAYKVQGSRPKATPPAARAQEVVRPSAEGARGFLHSWFRYALTAAIVLFLAFAAFSAARWILRKKPKRRRRKNFYLLGEEEADCIYNCLLSCDEMVRELIWENENLKIELHSTKDRISSSERLSRGRDLESYLFPGSREFILPAQHHTAF